MQGILNYLSRIFVHQMFKLMIRPVLQAKDEVIKSKVTKSKEDMFDMLKKIIKRKDN